MFSHPLRSGFGMGVLVIGTRERDAVLREITVADE